ncbi:MAG: hypothetical protein U9Q69_00555 [Nanoarchaeota archaeon]|nr:hypothetical protein [Nanoarchaeota archaeon]
MRKIKSFLKRKFSKKGLEKTIQEQEKRIKQKIQELYSGLEFLPKEKHLAYQDYLNESKDKDGFIPNLDSMLSMIELTCRNCYNETGKRWYSRLNLNLEFIEYRLVNLKETNTKLENFLNSGQSTYQINNAFRFIQNSKIGVQNIEKIEESIIKEAELLLEVYQSPKIRQSSQAIIQYGISIKKGIEKFKGYLQTIEARLPKERKLTN